MTDPAIDVRGLRNTYLDMAAVGGIVLQVRAGEALAQLGPHSGR